LRKIIKIRGGFPNEEAALKLLFLALRQAGKKWTMPIHHWREALNHFTISPAGTHARFGGSCPMKALYASTLLGRRRGTASSPDPSPKPKQALAVYTDELTQLAILLG
jgi:hypothetical protein